jgi:hypothetical protein
MSEQTENQEQLEQQEPTLTPIEEKAIQMGWRPKEQFEGDEEEFIDAKEFVRRQPLFDRIESQNKQLKNVTKALEALKVHYTRVEEAAVQKAINQLKAQRKSALADGDGDSFELIDDEIKKAEQQLSQIEQVKNNPIVEETVVHPEWQAFQSRNPWYTNTGYMRKFADEIGADLASKGIPPVEVLKQVEQAVRKEFPNKFVNPNKEQAPTVEQSRGSSKQTGKDSDSFMNEQERKVMNDLVRSGLLTKEKYIADLKAVKGLK